MFVTTRTFVSVLGSVRNVKYDFVEIAIDKHHFAFSFLNKLYGNISESTISRAIEGGYKLFCLLQNSEPVGIAAVYFYPHLTDGIRAWVHELTAIDDENSQEYKSQEYKSQEYKRELFTRIRHYCFTKGCPEVAIHVPVNDDSAAQFFGKEGGKHSALVYEWSKSSRITISDIPRGQQELGDYQFKEIKISDELDPALEFLRYFHPTVSRNTLRDAMNNGYQVFGLWMNTQLCSIATLVSYPDLKEGYRVWLQDGMTLPVKGYRQVASTIFDCILDFCFDRGFSTVNLHVKLQNKRTIRFYEQKAGKYTANVYKYRIQAKNESQT